MKRHLSNQRSILINDINQLQTGSICARELRTDSATGNHDVALVTIFLEKTFPTMKMSHKDTRTKGRRLKCNLVNGAQYYCHSLS